MSTTRISYSNGSETFSFIKEEDGTYTVQHVVLASWGVEDVTIDLDFGEAEARDLMNGLEEAGWECTENERDLPLPNRGGLLIILISFLMTAALLYYCYPHLKGWGWEN